MYRSVPWMMSLIFLSSSISISSLDAALILENARPLNVWCEF
jgi:hypothetical protein